MLFERLTRRRIPVLEARGVERVRRNPQHVPGRSGDEDVVVLRGNVAVAAEQVAQLRDVNVERLGGSRRRMLAPYVVDETVFGDHLVGRQRQSDQQRPSACARDRDGITVDARLQRPEQA